MDHDRRENRDDDDIGKLFSGLRDRDYAREGLFVCEGRLVIEKALAAGAGLRALVCVPSDEAMWRDALAAAGQPGISPRAMRRPEMEALVGFAFHRGAIALAERPGPPPASDAQAAGTQEAAATLTAAGNALLLWNVTDPDNLGALIRSAAALGAAAAYLGPGCADPLGRKALRSSMGCALSLSLRRVDSVEGLRAAGAMLLAAALRPGAWGPRRARRELDARGTGAILALGNEGWGLPDDIVSACDAVVALPMAGGVDSLNVGAAGAILMWELFGRFD